MMDKIPDGRWITLMMDDEEGFWGMMDQVYDVCWLKFVMDDESSR